MNSKFTGLSFEEIGEAMRPENLRGEAFRLSREERDHVAGHALDSIHSISTALAASTQHGNAGLAASSSARKIAALSNLLGDTGWEREGEGYRIESGVSAQWFLGELFPVAQLRPWLEEWQRQDNEALTDQEGNLEIALVAEDEGEFEVKVRQAITRAQTKLGTGAILLARIEKWMGSHEN